MNMTEKQPVYILANVLTKHKKKLPNGIDRNSNYELKGDGTIEVLQTLAGILPAEKKKPLAVNFDRLNREMTLKKNTHLQLKGYIEPLTKTQDIFIVSDLVVLSQAASMKMIQGLKEDPQQKRNELIASNKGFSLADGDNNLNIPNWENQEIQAINDHLNHYGFRFDLEMSYLILNFFKRRIRNRRKSQEYSVADTIRENPLLLAEMAFKEPSFNLQNLLNHFPKKFSFPIQIYVECLSIMQRLTQQGDSFILISTLTGHLNKVLGNDYKKTYDTLCDLLISKRDIQDQLGVYANLTTVTAKKSLSNICGAISEYYRQEYARDFPDEPEKAAQKAYNIANRPAVYLQKSFFSEYWAAEQFAALLKKDEMIDCLAEAKTVKGLDEDQKACLIQAFSNRISVIIGGAGSGKTRVVSEMVKILSHKGYSSVILAPSAKAAVHAAHEVSSNAKMDFPINYQTIHRFAVILPEDEDNGENGDFVAMDAEMEIPYQFIIIDEMGMCTLPVFNKVLKIVSKNPHIHLILVGDTAQLPAIGQQFFHQVCSGIIPSLPIVKLNKNYRAESNDLAKFALSIRRGELEFPKTSEHVSISSESPKEFLQSHPQLAIDPEALFLVNRKRDADALNNMLRKYRLNELNPVGLTGFYLKDKVITTQNDYANSSMPSETIKTNRHPERNDDVFNGTEGIIESFDEASQTVQVRLYAPGLPEEGKLIPYYIKELSLYFLPAYALTVHKAQGSQAKTIIYYMDPKTKSITRNALYTAVTRAKSDLYILGSIEQLQIAVKRRDRAGQTFFAFRVIEHLTQENEDEDDFSGEILI